MSEQKVKFPKINKVKVWMIVKGLTKKAFKSLAIHWVGTFTEEMQKKLIQELYEMKEEYKKEHGVNDKHEVITLHVIDVKKAFDRIKEKAVQDVKNKPAKELVKEVKEFLKQG